jgi:hypothetical protein
LNDVRSYLTIELTKFENIEVKSVPPGSNTEWLTLVDGGQTEVLKSEVVLADLSDCFDLYYALLSESPALSDEVMLKAIDKVYDFPASLLTAILQANPSSAKNQRILEALENRAEPLTDLQLFLIKQGVDIMSLKEQMELEMALIEEARCSAITEGLTYLSSIEDGGDYSVQTHQLQIMEFSPSDAYSALDYLIATGQNSDILAKFDLIAQNYTLTEWQANEHAALRDLYVLEAQSNYTYNFSTSEQGMLENNMDSKFDAVAMKATQLLSMQDPSFTNDPIFGSAATGYRSEQLTTVREEENQIKVYPNPTTDDVIIELPAIDYYVSYSIFNGQGQLIDTGNITDRSVLLTLDFHHLSSGVYNIRLYSSELKIPANLSIIKQ